MITSGEIQMKVTVGDLEVIGCGMAHTSKEDDLLVVLDNLIKLNFKFIKNDDDKSKRTLVEASKNEPNSGNVLVYNFDNPLGQGVLIPMLIGDLRGRELYMTFFTWTFPHNRIINYVFYLGNSIKK